MKKTHMTAENRRNLRSRAKMKGTDKRPRICVFRSNKHIYAQAIDDINNKVSASASDLKLEVTENNGKISKSIAISKNLAGLLQKLSVVEVVFDRNGYRYHGRIKAIAEELRNSGIKL